MKFSLRLLGVLLAALLFTRSGAVAQSARFTGLTPLYNPASGPRDGSMTFHCTADAAGNTFLMVRYRGSLRLGGTVVPAPADTLYRQAIAKLSPAGVLQWLRNINIEDSGVDCVSLQTDAAGNVYALGRICCGPVPHTVDGLVVSGPQEGTTAYVAKWSGLGVIQYATAFATTPSNPLATDLNPWRLAVSPSTGALAVTGMYVGAVVVGADTLRQIERPFGGQYINANAFVARLSATGTPQWALRMEDADSVTSSFATELGFDAADNLHFVGFYGASASPTPHTGINGVALPAHHSVFRIKLSPTAQVLYAEADPFVADSFGFAVAPDGTSYLAYTTPFSGALATGQPVRLRGREATLLARYAPDGRLQWWHQFDGRDSTDYVGVSQRMLALSRDGQEVYVGGPLTGVLRDGNLLLGTPAGPGARPNIWLAALSAAGEVLWGHTVTGSGGSHPWQLQALPGGEVGLLALGGGDSVGLGNLTISTPGNQTNKAFFAVLSRRYNTLNGAAYLDADADGIQGGTETGFPGGLVVEVNPGNIPCAAPASTGHYDAYVDLNVNFTATLPNPPPYYTVVAQGPATATFSTYGNVAAGRSFALQPIANQQDVQVILTLVSAARPGALVRYHVQYRNVGTVPISAGAVALAYDARLVFQSSTLPATGTGSATRTWAYTSLQPGETRRFSVVFRLPATTPLGVNISSTATLTPLAADLEPADNTSTAVRTVTGSYDPNDIEVNHVTLNTTQVAGSEWLEYTIRFQNHGTDTAFAVLLRDTLPVRQVQMLTFQMLAASHNCAFGFNPSGAVIFNMTGIALPPQITDAVNSDGFVRFRVRTRPTLLAGDQIPNRAAIIFDYNPAMLTNVARTDILGLTGLSEAGAGAAVSVWPNPATSTLHVALPAGGGLTLTLLDAVGRTVRTETVPADATGATRITLDVRGLPAGLYVLRGAGAGADAGAPFARRVVVR